MEIDLQRAFIILVTCLLAPLLFLSAGHTAGKSSNCLQLIKPLQKKIEDVQSHGGIWGIYSKTPSLGRDSSKAIALDSRLNKLVGSLIYLCDTRKGVPLNELASYVSRKVAEMGETRFKNLHVDLGKPEQEIETWLQYTKIALSNRDRTLEMARIEKSIQGAGVLVTQYGNLFAEFIDSPDAGPVLQKTISLNRKIDQFWTADPYVALAILEESQIPFWDIDENYGGS